MTQQFGVTAAGFVTKQQQQIITEQEASLKTAFGANINLAGTSVFGQLVGLFSEREALVWQVAEAVYDSEYPSGAEGSSVDNVLSFTNLRRLPAMATKTAPTDTSGIPGLVLYGTPGTFIQNGSLIGILNSTVQFKLDADVTIQPAVNAVQSIFFSNVPDTGNFSISIEDQFGNVLTTSSIPYNATASKNVIQVLTFSAVPVSGSYKINIGSNVTPLINWNDNAGTIQGYIQAFAGYAGTTVTGNTTIGFTITLPAISQPLIVISNNTLNGGITITPTPRASIEAAIAALFDVPQGVYPYTDVRVTGFTAGFVITFGAASPTGGNPASGGVFQKPFVLVTNSLQSGFTVTNINIVQSAIGAPAQAIGSATCTQTGPNFVGAGSLTIIGSPVTGWASVNNPLDCLTGSNIEDDTSALQRRLLRLNSNANGPIQSIVQKVQAVAGVSAAIGFQNLTDAALQVLTFSQVPTSGQYQIVIRGYNTSNIQWNDGAATIQTKVRLLPGYSTALVSGSTISGFTIDFNGSYGGQPQELAGIANNSLLAGIVAVVVTPAFGRPGKSIEIVAQGGDQDLIAQTIWKSKPGGIETYGNVTRIVTDSFLKKYPISFSRPTQVKFYITINMVTDLLTADVPQFNPSSILAIQQELVNIGNAVPIGGLIVGFGSAGLIGAFNNIPGIISYQIGFDRVPNPALGQTANIQLQSEEAPQFETFNITVSYT